MTKPGFFNRDYNSLIPIECFLNRVFPPGFYESEIASIVHERQFKPRKDCVPFKLVAPIDWQGSKYESDRNWRMQLQGWAMFHPIMNIFDAFEDKPVILEYFFDIINDWMRCYGDENEVVTTSRMPTSYTWYDMSVGFRALVLSFFINRINYFDLTISSEQEEVLDLATRKHINNLCFKDAFSLNNHGLFQIQGLMALLNLTNYNENLSRKPYALERMEELIHSQFSDEGIHKEHSPHYHFYATDTALSIVKTGWYNSSNDLETIISKADYNKCWMVDPLKRPVCVGDSILTVQKKLAFPETSGDETIVGDFSQSGYSIVKSDWKAEADKTHMLFMMGMYHTKSHKHRDCLSFELFDRGTRLLCDSGKYGYRSDKYRNYFLSHRAHNTVEIEGFDIIKIKPYKTSLETIVKDSNDNYILKGSLDYPAIKHYRTLTYRPNDWLLVNDELNFVRGRKFTQWFHIGIGFELVSYKDGYYKFVNQSSETIEIECLNKELTPEFHFGDEHSMQGFVSENDYVYEKAIAIGFSGVGKLCNINTIIKYSNDTSFSKYLQNTKDLSNIISIELKNSLKKPLLKNVKSFFFEKGSIKIPLGESTSSCIYNNVPISFYGNRKKKSSSLLVMLPGATNREKGSMDFQRYSWSKDINCHVLSFTDPTINPENELSIGWFQYKAEVNCFESVSKVILEAAKSLNVDESNITLFGSSAGGFTALKLSEYLQSANVIAINPQLYLHHYTRSFYEAMVDYSYQGGQIEDIKHTSHKRTIVDHENMINRSGKTSIVQNIHDTRHLDKHLKTMLNKLHDSDYSFNEIPNWNDIKIEQSINIYIYSDDTLKHSPPSKADTLTILNKIGI